jgi:hypothetical protein
VKAVGMFAQGISALRRGKYTRDVDEGERAERRERRRERARSGPGKPGCDGSAARRPRRLGLSTGTGTALDALHASAINRELDLATRAQGRGGGRRFQAKGADRLRARQVGNGRRDYLGRAEIAERGRRRVRRRWWRRRGKRWRGRRRRRRYGFRELNSPIGPRSVGERLIMAEVYQSQLGVSGGPNALRRRSRGVRRGRRSRPRASGRHARSIDPPFARARSRQRGGRRRRRAGSSIDRSTIRRPTRATRREPGGAGHSEAIVKSIDDVTAQNLGSIKDPHIRARLQAALRRARDRVGTREYGWEATQRVGKLVGDVDEQGTHYANAKPRARTSAPSFNLHDVATTVGALTMLRRR